MTPELHYAFVGIVLLSLWGYVGMRILEKFPGASIFIGVVGLILGNSFANIWKAMQGCIGG